MIYTWNKNLQNFKRRFPQLFSLYEKDIINFQNTFYDSKTQTFSIPFLNISTAKNGEVTATQNNLSLHSSYNPTKESIAILPKIKDSKTIIFLGFGLGYHVVNCAKEIISSNKKLVLIESDLYYFLTALIYLDWEEVFNIPELILAIGCPIDQIIPLIENNTKISLQKNDFIFTNQAFTKHNESYFLNVKELLQRNIQKNKINNATFTKFIDLWISNTLKNVNKIQSVQTLNNYINIFPKNITDFIIIGAGPSLQKILPYLKELQKNHILICVETALHSLIKNDIQPDFILLTDPQYWAYKHIASIKSPESILICPISVYPATFRFNCKQILLCSDMTPLSSYFEEQTSSFGDLGAGGSVASCAFNLAILLGAKKVYFAGLDLSFPNKQTHIKGSSSEQNFFINSNRIQSIDKMNSSILFSSNPSYSKDYQNKKVLTDSKMKMFAWWFESRIASCKNIDIYSLCKESLNIPGVQFLDVNNLLNKSIFDFRLSDEYLDYVNKQTKLDCCSHVCSNYKTVIEQFILEKNNLLNLLNKAIELCMINKDNLNDDLKIIDEEIQKNKLNVLTNLIQVEDKSKLENYLFIKKTLRKLFAEYNYNLQDV